MRSEKACSTTTKKEGIKRLALRLALGEGEEERT